MLSIHMTKYTDAKFLQRSLAINYLGFVYIILPTGRNVINLMVSYYVLFSQIKSSLSP